jgi:hypothetical protein
MLLIAALLALDTPTEVVAERKAWYECLEIYAQVAMVSATSPATIATNALATCADERKAFQLKALRSNSANDGPSFAALLDREDRDAAKHIVVFINRNRR